ncbi:uncharacterized protein LOC110822874 [Carica papaya]|uniref:uncharacterized protein LOC110822874 n=1 Tax=Carica papaya TaxID=3649 RepID=UPI000B8CF9A8|nr:uncharacterized protein LOC110822874 [Carica papaya]
MGSSLHQWESDPLFTAAEVVQDSADRMESIFRLLLHEQSLVHDDHADPRLLTSIEYHRRDLATILETAKWQLEDFERAVCLSATMDKYQMKEDVISRHRQFIRAIREQINHVRKSIEDPSTRNSMNSLEWVNLNEQDRDGLAVFLSGGNPMEQINHHEMEDSSILRRFLDPTTTSTSKDAEIVQHEIREVQNLNINGGPVHADDYYDSLKVNDLRMVGSHHSTKLCLDVPDSCLETSCRAQIEDEKWDLEANIVKPESSFHRNKLKGLFGRMNIVRFLFPRNVYGGVPRNYTKQMKDGEEQKHSPESTGVSHALKDCHFGTSLSYGRNIQGLYSRFFMDIRSFFWWLGTCGTRYARSQCHLHNQHFLQMILTIILALILLGLLVSQLA